MVELLGALPVDVEQEILAFLEARLDLRFRRSVKVAEDLGPFEEFAGFDHRFEPGVVDEAVIEPVGLAGADRTGGDRDRHGDLLVLFEQPMGDRGLAGPRGRGEYEHQSAALERVAGHGRCCRRAMGEIKPSEQVILMRSLLGELLVAAPARLAARYAAVEQRLGQQSAPDK